MPYQGHCQEAPARLRLTARLLQSLKLLAGDRLAVLTLRQALRAPAYALWDEEKARMVRFADLRTAAPAP